MNIDYAPTAATSGPVTIDVSKTATNELDLGPLLAERWRRIHAGRLAGGAKYWRRRRVPRWVRYMETMARLRESLGKIAEARFDSVGVKSADVRSDRPQAALSLIQRADGKYLCVWNRRYNGWGLPGGKVESGETLTEAQARELREETGLETKEATLVYSAPTVSSDSGRIVHIFRVTPVGDTKTPFEIEPGSLVDFRSREELLADSPFKAFYEAMFAQLEVTT